MAQITKSDYKCPLCGSALTSQKYEEARLRMKQDVERELTELKQSQQKVNSEMKQIYEQQFEEMRKSFQMLRDIDIKRSQEEQNRREETYSKALEQKQKELDNFLREQERFKQLAVDEAKSGAQAEVEVLRNDVRERDIQIQRANSEVDSLKRQLSQTQSELKGEAGEIDLFDQLSRAFPNDRLIRKKRGEASADLVQTIVSPSSTLDVPIAFDMKQANTITKDDIERAKGYRKIHGTNYVVIVSRNIPKKYVPNGLFGERDGVLLVHPSLVIEITRHIRGALIELRRQDGSREDIESKQAMLYDYIRGPEYQRAIEELFDVHKAMSDLQRREERYHQTLWKERKNLSDKLVDTGNNIASGVDSIFQGAESEIEQVDEGENAILSSSPDSSLG
jgi:hypothetical protein